LCAWPAPDPETIWTSARAAYSQSGTFIVFSKYETA